MIDVIIFSSLEHRKQEIKCDKIHLNDTDLGQLVILPNYQNSVFNIQIASEITFFTQNDAISIAIKSNAIAKFNNNVLMIFI